MTASGSDQEGLDTAAIFGSVRRVLHEVLGRLPSAEIDDTLPKAGLDLFVVLGRNEPFPLAQLWLDAFATELADTFGQMSLSPPAAYNADVMLHARVAAPGSEGVRVAIESAVVETMRTCLGDDVHPSIAVRPAGGRSRETAVVQVFFPLGTDPVSFASGFNTRDYFRWQIDLGTFPGVGAVTSEPCSVLGADVPVSDLLPPNLMISFAIVGDTEATVRTVIRDLQQRLADAIEPEEIMVGVSVSIDASTPNAVRAEIERRKARGYELLDIDEDSLQRPMDSTSLLFGFPLPSGTDTGLRPADGFRGLRDADE